MANLADYKVIKDNSTHIGSHQNHEFNFILADNVVKSAQAQRPYLVLTETIEGGLPGSVSIALNGHIIENREGDINNLLSINIANTRVVLFDGGLLNTGSNTLKFSVISQNNLSLDLDMVIVHFQRDV